MGAIFYGHYWPSPSDLFTGADTITPISWQAMLYGLICSTHVTPEIHVLRTERWSSFKFSVHTKITDFLKTVEMMSLCNTNHTWFKQNNLLWRTQYSCQKIIYDFLWECVFTVIEYACWIGNRSSSYRLFPTGERILGSGLYFDMYVLGVNYQFANFFGRSWNQFNEVQIARQVGGTIPVHSQAIFSLTIQLWLRTPTVRWHCKWATGSRGYAGNFSAIHCADMFRLFLFFTLFTKTKTTIFSTTNCMDFSWKTDVDRLWFFSCHYQRFTFAAFENQQGSYHMTNWTDCAIIKTMQRPSFVCTNHSRCVLAKLSIIHRGLHW
jgi:hypothetical protein